MPTRVVDVVVVVEEIIDRLGKGQGFALQRRTVRRLVEIVVMQMLMLFQVIEVIGMAHVMVVVVVVEMRLVQHVVCQVFDVVRMQDGRGRQVVVVMGRGRRRAGGRRRRRGRGRVLLVKASTSPAAQERHGRHDDDGQGGNESDGDDLRQSPAQQMRLLELEEMAAD